MIASTDMSNKGRENKILIILGPTSTGKTDLALQFASKFQGELVSVDSRQVYKGLDIGTGKLPGHEVTVKKGRGFWEMDGIKVWMYDVVDLKKQYTVYDYVQGANKVIDDIVKRGKLPIIVGGTGLYLKALLEGLPNLAVPINQELRKQLNNLTIKQLQQRLQISAPGKWKSMNYSDRQNPRRLIRAIELVMLQPQRIKQLELRIKDFNILKIGLIAPREILYKKINSRVEKWIREGIVNEVLDLIKNGISKKRIRDLGLEYKVVIDYLNGDYSLNMAIEKMQNKVRQYAKRQITWFKQEKDVVWFDIIGKGYLAGIEKLVSTWYDSSRACYA